MRRPGFPRAIALRLVACVLLALVGHSTVAQDYYRERLRAGTAALDNAFFEDAVIDLELACFGMLDNPAQRAGCKALYFLAQLGKGDHAAAEETLQLIARLEQRHAAYAGASLSSSRRLQFEQAVLEHFPNRPSGKNL